MANIILNFRCKTLEEWTNDNEIIGDGGIALIDFPDGHRKVVIGDGKTKCLDCKELKKFPKSLKINYDRRIRKGVNAFVRLNEDNCV